MNIQRSSPVMRTGAFVLSLILVSAAFWSSFFTLLRWDDLWSGGDYFSSAYRDTSNDTSRVKALLELRQRKEWEGDLTYSDQERLQALEEALSPERTNFRYQVHDQEGRLLDSNLGGAELSDAVGQQEMFTFYISTGDSLRNQDYSYYDGETERQMRMIFIGDGFVAVDPAEASNEYNEYGWLSDGSSWARYDSDYDTRVKSVELVLEYGISNPMVVNDYYTERMHSYQAWQSKLPIVAVVALVTIVLSLGAVSFLCTAAGRREDGTISPAWQDRIPYDLYLTADFLLAAFLVSAGDGITTAFNADAARPAVLVGLGVFTLLAAAATLSLLVTTAVRLKTRTLLRNTVIWRCCAACWRFCKGLVRGWSLNKRAVWLFLLYLLGTVLTGLTIVLIPVFQGFVLWCILRWLRQWRAIRAGTDAIVGGDPDLKIDTTGMYKDLRQHAEQLNDLGSAIGNAVDERMQSERFKAELITNVSHDLKTPLTSIINYVDLLKKVPLENPQAAEYIEVLDRKSQRLKKLTEDLVEASKASTGNLSVSQERLGMVQLVAQAMGEYEEKFAQKGLALVPTLPTEELWVWADGRHLWRVIDNLLSNCYKYALEGTRIYLDVTRWDGHVNLSVKNISRQALNIPPEQLMERFVRGEEARSTEGSGLGLSIARSLTELQGGEFRLAIDGDLFKAMVIFPEAMALPEPENTPDDAQSA